MADDFDDVEDMLEAPFRKDAGVEGNGEQLSPGRDGRKRRSKHRGHRRSRHSRSRSTSRSPRRRRRRSDSQERRRRSRSRDRYQRSRSRDQHRRSRSRDKHQWSRSRDRQKYSMSPQRSPGRRHSYRGGGRGSGGGRGRGGGDLGMDPMFRRHSPPEPEPPSEERDRRTVMCMQLAAYVGPKELEEFFQKVGQVKEVKMIADKNSRRSKGIAYIEFHDESSVPAALQQTGQKLYGVPIIVQPTMAEKNRLAALAQNLMKKEGPRNLYVGSLHYHITDVMLKNIFEPFGHVDKIAIQRDENGLSKGYGFIEFRDSEAAERAKENLDGFELAGRPMKVNHVTERSDHIGGGAMEMLDSENFTTGVGMTQQGRANLMAKLAVGHNAGLVVPTIPALANPVGVIQPGATPVVSSCMMLTNMFDLLGSKEPGWEEDIRDDVLEELMAFGNVVHIYVDTLSQGNVYVKTANSQVSSSAISSLDGRFFAGKKVTAQRIPELTYHMKFPEAIAAVSPLKPS